MTKLCEKYKETGNEKERNDRRTGAPLKTTPRQDRALVHSSQRDRFKTAPQHRRDLIAMGTRLSLATIKRRQAEANLNGRVARKKPLITKVNTQAHLKSKSKRIMIGLSNESPYPVFPKCGRLYVRRRPGEEFNQNCLKPTVKHGGGKIMLWGCVSEVGMGQLTRIEGKLDAEAYYRVLRYQMAPAMRCQGGRQVLIFMQDNAPAHKSKKALTFLQRNNYVVLDHPAQSPDLNPLENIWWAIKQTLLDMPLPSNADDLYEKIKQIWENYPKDELVKYIESMPSCIEAVIQAKGWRMKY